MTYTRQTVAEYTVVFVDLPIPSMTFRTKIEAMAYKAEHPMGKHAAVVRGRKVDNEHL